MLAKLAQIGLDLVGTIPQGKLAPLGDPVGGRTVGVGPKRVGGFNRMWFSNPLD